MAAPVALARFLKDRRGVAAVEFALIAPLMVLSYFGVAELSQGLIASRKASAVAATIGDLTAQASAVTPTDLADIFSVGKQIMQPYPADGRLRMRLSSVTVDAANTPRVDWSQGSGMDPLARGAAVTLPLAAKAQASDPDRPFIPQGQSVIMAEARYAFDSPVAQYLPATSTLSDKLFLLPRQGLNVPCNGC